MAASRVYVHRAIAKAFTDAYVAKMKDAASKLGDPQDDAVSLGPLVDSTAFERVKAMIERGKQDAELVVGGVQHGEQGCFMEPTVFLNPKPGAQILTDEVFGPVAVVKTFESEEEVVRLANDTEYGLMAGVFTKDISRALRVSAKIESGVVGINCISVVSCDSFFCPRSMADGELKHLLTIYADEYPSTFRWEEGFGNWTRIW